jgi:hypothetical protein
MLELLLLGCREPAAHEPILAFLSWERMSEETWVAEQLR